MPLAYQPHSWTVQIASEVIQSDDVLGTDRTAGATIRGQITPMAANVAYEKWGLELNRPHLALMGTEYEGVFKTGDWFEMNGRLFSVKAIKVWNALPGVNCLEAALEEITDGAL